MPDNLSILMKVYHESMEAIFDARLKKVLLYGSCARGDFRQDSDVDIMILADVQPEEVSCYADRVYDVTYDFEMQYGVEINPSIQSIYTYNQWKEVYPFFMNIEKEGIAV